MTGDARLPINLPLPRDGETVGVKVVLTPTEGEVLRVILVATCDERGGKLNVMFIGENHAHAMFHVTGESDRDFTISAPFDAEERMTVWVERTR